MNAIENIVAKRLLQKRCSHFCLVLLVGCSALPTPPNRPVSVRLLARADQPARRRPPRQPASPIALADVEATACQSSTAVLYRLNYADAQQLRPYTLARWTQPPVQLVQQAPRAS